MNMLDISFKRSEVEGREPIHRTAYLGQDFLVTAQGNLDEDRWVLGWPAERKVNLPRLVGSAIDVLNKSVSPDASVSGYAFVDDHFEPVRREGENTQETLLEDFRTFLKARDTLPPVFIVVSKGKFQIEVIFEPNTYPYEPSTITVLTNSQEASAFAGFFSMFHARKEIREDVPTASNLLQKLCSKNIWEITDGIESPNPGWAHSVGSST